MSDESTALTVSGTLAPEVYDEKRGALKLRALFSQDLKDNVAAIEFLRACQHYELDPFAGEVYPYQGHIYVSEAGWREKIGRHLPGQLAGIDSRLATMAERAAYSIPDGDQFAVATVTRRLPTGELFTTTARATVRFVELTKKEVKYRPIDVEPWYMAEKRARVRALRIAFGDALKGHIPNGHEEKRRPAPSVTVAEEPAAEIAAPVAVDTETGEILNEAVTVAAHSFIEAESIKAETGKRSAEEARRGFFATATGLGGLLTAEGKPSQFKIHKVLGLNCGQRLHDQAAGAGCKALSERIAALVADRGVTEAEAWHVLTGELLVAQEPGSVRAVEEPIEGEAIQSELEINEDGE